MFRLFTAFAEGLRMHRHFRAVLRELRTYSTAELNDLGVAPGDIARLAMEEAERRVDAERRPESDWMPDGVLVTRG